MTLDPVLRKFVKAWQRRWRETIAKASAKVMTSGQVPRTSAKVFQRRWLETIARPLVKASTLVQVLGMFASATVTFLVTEC